MVVPWFNRRDRSDKLNRNANGERFFSYETLRIATNNFSTVIGHGGFGSVYKGVLPDEGRIVAVKRFGRSWSPDRDGFLEMVDYMSHLRHTNLIQVIGCCVEKDQQLLVTEYAEKGSVAKLLRDSTRSAFNWEKRAAVCIGTARGLSYIHEDINPQVVHRDIKPPNILLDANVVPKIADFDLVRFVGCSRSVSVRGGGTGEETFDISGTYGYLDPEYAVTGRFSKKVDVYSFGVAMLEIISGRPPNLWRDSDLGSRDLLRYAMALRKDGKILELVDPMLVDFPKEEVERFLNVALLCTQLDSKQRPNMFEVVLMLYGAYKSNQEISELSMRAVTAHPPPWFIADSVQVSAEDGGMVDEAPCSSHSSIVLHQSSSSRAQSCEMSTDVSSYFRRSIQKIKEFQASSATSNGTRSMSQTMVMRRVSMEAVYPPFLSREYPPSNPFCNRKWQ